MLSANARIEIRHHWDSKWHSWPTNERGVLYWSKEDGDRNALVYLLGNPLVVWPVGILASIASVWMWVRLRLSKGEGVAIERPTRYGFSWFAVLAVGLNLLPYMGVERSAFIYHYLPGLMYAQLLAGLVLDELSLELGGMIVRGMILLMAIGLHRYAPWVYAFWRSKEHHDGMRWKPTWN
jgi:dolichyl-phosphate-mannose--protein O-mannosyl transferase